MTDLTENISKAAVDLPVAAYRRMLQLVKLLHGLSESSAYRQQVYPLTPEIARIDPGHASVMMCYDFHLVDETPRLIEVNTNAGGGQLACMACDQVTSTEKLTLSPALEKQLLAMFADEISAFSRGRTKKPTRIVIIDKDPGTQHLYPEMLAFAALLEKWGPAVNIIDPADLDEADGGLFYAGEQIEMIYNRHCDFYLDTPAMAKIRTAYSASNVCLTPNPHMFGLLADKRRMILWSNPASRASWNLAEDEKRLLDEVVPKASLLAEHDMQALWSERKLYAFKPVDSFGSRGVLLGEKISRKRFNELPLQQTLVQEFAPPGKTDVADYGEMKTDFRLYAYRDQPLGITARLYQGQVTNMRTPGGGFARVNLV